MAYTNLCVLVDGQVRTNVYYLTYLQVKSARPGQSEHFNGF
jgi:hypothetical protein